jgi:UDP-3-O-[3-hydroxymyristoyl] N-acetylglucosamine deacetylase
LATTTEDGTREARETGNVCCDDTLCCRFPVRLSAKKSRQVIPLGKHNLKDNQTQLSQDSPCRLQRTLRKPAEIQGVGFFTGADVSMTLLPADENHGIVFQRTDLKNSPLIPATIEHTVERHRRTAITRGDASVELTEHLLAALYGLQVDNCLVQLDAPELPGCDGSAQAFVDAILQTEIVNQSAARSYWCVERELGIGDPDVKGDVLAKPSPQQTLEITYQLEYDGHSPIPSQSLHLEINPETFLSELSYARTFVLEEEVQALRDQGFGKRVTEKDLLVFQADGSILGNELRAPDECVRHKMLDCIGDFALFGCDLYGKFHARRSGHRLNRKVVRKLRIQQSANLRQASHRAA